MAQNIVENQQKCINSKKTASVIIKNKFLCYTRCILQFQSKKTLYL